MADDMIKAIISYNDLELIQYLQVIENEGNHEKVMQRCKICLCSHDETTLMLALNL